MDKGWELYQMYDVVEHTIEYAFKGKFMLNMYEYLKSIKATKRDVEEFIWLESGDRNHSCPKLLSRAQM